MAEGKSSRPPFAAMHAEDEATIHYVQTKGVYLRSHAYRLLRLDTSEPPVSKHRLGERCRQFALTLVYFPVKIPKLIH